MCGELKTKREAFSFYASFLKTAMKIKDPLDRLRFFEAVAFYGLNEELIDMSNNYAADVAFEQARANLDSGWKKRRNRLAKTVEQHDSVCSDYWEKQSEDSIPQCSQHLNYNGNHNEDGNENVKDNSNEYGQSTQSISSECEEIVDFLNQRCGTSYRPSAGSTKKLIKARLAEGFSVDDFKMVIDKKAAEWSGTEYEKYLRPETLFGSKFGTYLGQPVPITTHKENPTAQMLHDSYAMMDGWAATVKEAVS